jgi:tellurite resistance protein TerC
VIIVGTLVVTAVVSLLRSRHLSRAEMDAATGPRRDWDED